MPTITVWIAIIFGSGSNMQIPPHLQFATEADCKVFSKATSMSISVDCVKATIIAPGEKPKTQ